MIDIDAFHGEIAHLFQFDNFTPDDVILRLLSENGGLSKAVGGFVQLADLPGIRRDSQGIVSCFVPSEFRIAPAYFRGAS